MLGVGVMCFEYIGEGTGIILVDYLHAHVKKWL